MVEAEAVIDTPNKYGATALHLGLQCVNDNSYEITQILFKAGAKISKKVELESSELGEISMKAEIVNSPC